MAADKLAALQPVQHAMQAVSFVVLEVNSFMYLSGQSMRPHGRIARARYKSNEAVKESDWQQCYRSADQSAHVSMRMHAVGA